MFSISPKLPNFLDLAKLATLNETDEFVPLGMRQPDDVGLLSDCDALIGNLDLRARLAKRAQRELFPFQSYLLES